MTTIDTINTTTYGLYISSRKGELNLPDLKEQFYIAYGYQGYQATRRTANTLELNGFIIADGVADFNTKTAALYAAIIAPGLRTILQNGDTYTGFSKDGYTISNVRAYPNAMYAKFHLKITLNG